MSIFEPANEQSTRKMRAVLRIVSAAVFIPIGSMKVLGFPPGLPPGVDRFPLWTQTGIGGWMEVIGGILILLGLFTRPVAFILAGEMAVAYFQFHAPTSFWPTVNLGAPAILYCFLFLYLTFAGPGAWSLDEVIARSREGQSRDSS